MRSHRQKRKIQPLTILHLSIIPFPEISVVMNTSTAHKRSRQPTFRHSPETGIESGVLVASPSFEVSKARVHTARMTP